MNRRGMSVGLAGCCALALLIVGVGRTFSADPPAESKESKAGASEPVPDLGVGASLHGKRVFPADNLWNEDISAAPVDANSDNLIASIGANKGLHPDFGTVWKARRRESLM